MLHMPSPMLFGGANGPSYGDWIAHGSARGAQSTPAAVQPMTGGLYAVTLAPSDLLYLALFGTPWMGWWSGYFENAVRHSLPSAAEMTAQKVAGRVVLVDMIYSDFNAQTFGLDRNGKASTGTLAGGNGGFRINEASFWSDAVGGPLTMNPSLGAGPTPYAATGWSN